MRSGWFKFHRQIFDNPICTKDSEYFYVWVWILSEANYEETRVWFKNRDIVLQKGQLLTSTSKISTELHIERSKVKRILKALKNEHQIDTQISNQNTLITVLNWDKYQFIDTRNDTRVTCGRHADDMQMDNLPIIKEIKNIRNKEYIYKGASETSCKADIQRIIEKWNTLSEVGLKPIRKIGSGTKVFEQLCARVREYGIEEVLSTVDMIKDSDFLLGKTTNFTITIDWFSRPNNFQKIYNGNYSGGKDDTQGKNTGDKGYIQRYIESGGKIDF